MRDGREFERLARVRESSAAKERGTIGFRDSRVSLVLAEPCARRTARCSSASASSPRAAHLGEDRAHVLARRPPRSSRRSATMRIEGVLGEARLDWCRSRRIRRPRGGARRPRAGTPRPARRRARSVFHRARLTTSRAVMSRMRSTPRPARSRAAWFRSRPDRRSGVARPSAGAISIAPFSLTHSACTPRASKWRRVSAGYLVATRTCAGR